MGYSAVSDFCNFAAQCTILSAKKSNFLPGQVVWFEGLLCNLVGVGFPFPSWKGGQVLHTADSFTGHAKMQQNAFYISLLLYSDIFYWTMQC